MMDGGIAGGLRGTGPVNKEHSIPLFEVKDIRGKGRGLVASVDISPGTRILYDKPLLTAGPMPPDELVRVLAAGLKTLSRSEQRQFLSLHNNFPGKHPFGAIFKTNALPCGSGSSTGGVYPTACLINHSCLPNSHNSWNSEAKHEAIYAIRPIKCGDEITIPYDRGGPVSVRRAFLKQAFGFDCECRGCSLAPPQQRASDERRLSIQRLDDAIGDPFRMVGRPRESLRDCGSLLQILTEEHEGCFGALIARLYYDAFQICVAHGDRARAGVFAHRSYRTRTVCEGEENPVTQRVRSLALDPTAHPSYGSCSMKWKTTVEMVPKGLGTAQFEKWLFGGF